MKKIFALLIAVVLLFSGCSSGITRDEIEDTVWDFTEALKVYDRDEMSGYLTQFPDNSPYIYIDDIFNDAEYIALYQTLFSDITYKIKSVEKNHAVVEYTIPDVQKLFATTSAHVLSLTLSNEMLAQKLAENEMTGINFIRELMRMYANTGDNVEIMTKEFTLTFQQEAGKTVIVCDDSLRALITGNFFLSKSITKESIENSAD